MVKQRNLTITLLPALLLMALAGLVRFVIVERGEILPANYSHTLEYTAESQFRQSINEKMSSSSVSVRNVAQTLTVTGPVSIIQNDLYWYTTAGELIFQSQGLYGVDRSTRMNLAGYGNTSRSGQFLFPPNIKQESFTLWDAMFIGPRQVEFEEIEMLDGLKLYKFHFYGKDMDETAGYASLPDVPEHYRVQTNGVGTLWIEPLTGVLVNYEESGVSQYVDPVTDETVADLFIWRDTFTPETRNSQTALARRDRVRIQALKTWLPGVPLATGLAWLLIGIFVIIRNSQKKSHLSDLGTFADELKP